MGANSYVCRSYRGKTGRGAFLPPPSWIGLMLPSKFKFSSIIEDFVLKLLKDMNIDKASGIDNLSGKFLKDGA